MKKIKITMTEARQNHRILSVGYCELQGLLEHQEPVAYSCGVYGWNCDYYDIDGVTICTGYRTIKTKNVIEPDYETIRKYEDVARAISSNYNLKFEERKIKINELLHKFIKNEVLTK